MSSYASCTSDDKRLIKINSLLPTKWYHPSSPLVLPSCPVIIAFPPFLYPLCTIYIYFLTCSINAITISHQALSTLARAVWTVSVHWQRGTLMAVPVVSEEEGFILNIRPRRWPFTRHQFRGIILLRFPVFDTGYHVELAGGGHYNAAALRSSDSL